mgnify:FL=1
MKKILSSSVILIAFLIGIFGTTFSANAQKGEKALGLMGGYATENDGGYTNLYFHYSFLDHLRLAPEIGYVFKNKGESAFEMAVDLHFPFRLARGFSVYPLTGVTLNSWKCHDTYTRVGFDFGAGFDIYLTNYLKLNLQGKYSLMNDFSGGFIGMGIAYLF